MIFLNLLVISYTTLWMEQLNEGVYNMSIQTIERTTLTNLIWDEDYARKVIPFIKPEYYADKNERVIFEEITKFTEKYNAIPTQEASHYRTRQSKGCQ